MAGVGLARVGLGRPENLGASQPEEIIGRKPNREFATMGLIGRMLGRWVGFCGQGQALQVRG